MRLPTHTIAPTDRLVSQIAEYQQLCLVQVNEATKRRKVSHLIHFIEDEYIFNVRQIDAKLVQLHLNHLAEIDYGHSSLKARMGAIYSFCEYLVKIGEIQENPCDHVRNPLKARNELPHYLNDEQMEQIFTLAKEIAIAGGAWTMYEPILLAAKSGLTINEIQIIEWNFFDFCGKLLTTYRPKTRKSRTVPMHHRIIEVFEPRNERSGYIFKRPYNSNVYNISNWHRWLDEIQKKCPFLLGWHDFRRTFAVRLGKAGVPPVDVMHYLGHANLDTTMRYMNWQQTNYNPNIENA